MTLHQRTDYRPYPFHITATDLTFEIDRDNTKVTAILQFESKKNQSQPMVLNGEHIELQSVTLNEKVLVQDIDYQLDHSTLTLLNMPNKGTVTIQTVCHPSTNTSLSGLFTTGEHMMTQCEAQGFRRMTYFPDRPDVLSVYTVKLIANQTQFPVLLSNGNLVKHEQISTDIHSTTWHDPFPKPSYLFALVAGKLECIEETIEQDGKSKLLQVYVEPHDIPKAQFAMDSLKASIHWDKSRFGLPLDLDRFMIVATSDFNMGAMENKGLNIFNTKFVLAHPETATDIDFDGVEAVVGHEYFHNWTGNRVTCQDWFQLSLKEGLTVYRDQEFSSDQLAVGLSPDAAATARAVKRIDDVSALRTAQFAEDAGPMAHPIRPNAYEEINNFYTMTVYEKGAEVVRMYETLLGRDGFRRGMDLYFERHDGQAVTCDDFRAAMADANGVNLDQFGRWYEQAGTPIIKVTDSYDAATQTYQLTFTQSNPAVGIETQQADLIKQPLHIPFAMGLLASQDVDGVALGQSLSLYQTSTQTEAEPHLILNITEASQTFVFSHVPCKPIPSLNRNFSAPVVVDYGYSDDDLVLILQHDTDAFNRWDALQQLFTSAILAYAKAPSDAVLSGKLISTLQTLLTDDQLSTAYRAQLFSLPSFAYLAQIMSRQGKVEPQALFAARQQAALEIARGLHSAWQSLYDQLNSKVTYHFNGTEAGRRALKNMALHHLSMNGPAVFEAVAQQYAQADNMTDRMAAFSAAVQYHADQAQPIITDFYHRFEQEALVIDKWFATQAANGHTSTELMQSTLDKLLAHPAFNNPNPNRLRALVFNYCNANPKHFHQPDGSGYDFWADQVIAINAKNPQVAARLARTLEHWKEYAEPYSSKMKKALEKVRDSGTLSQDVAEIIHKALAG